MRKRRYGDTLTGGTRDFNPQYFSTSVTQSANDTTTTATVSTPPGIGLSMSGKKPLAMELLKAYVEFETSGGGVFSPASAQFAPGATTASEITVKLYGSSKNFSTTAPSLSMGDATVFLYARRAITVYESTAASTMILDDIGPIQIDFTDGDGHGILYANQNMYFQLVSNATGITNVARIKLIFREKYITEEELLGLVLQSNQN